VVAVAGLVGTPFHASADDAENAESLVLRGLELRRQHDDVTALALFQRAYSLESTPRCRAQIALAEQSLGQWIAAETDLQAALAQADDAWIAQHRTALEQALGFVATHLGWLQIDSNVQGAEVAVNGASVGATPMAKPVRVATGSALVHVSARGYATVERTVKVEASDHAREFVELSVREERPRYPPVPSVVAASPPTHEPLGLQAKPVSAHGPLFWSGVALSTAGAVGLGIGAFYGVRVFVDKAARDQHCSSAGCDSTGIAFDDRARTDATTSTVAVIAGAAAVAGGIVLLWKGIEGERSPAVALAPQVGPGGGGARLVGVF
jgi:serine/threonine-protein kinase